MTKYASVLLLAILACSGARAGQSVDAAVRDLGDTDTQKRLAATDALLAAGETARAALDAAAKSGNADVKGRAEMLLNALDVEPKLEKALSALTAAKSLSCDLDVTRTKGALKGHFSGHTDSARYLSEVKIPTPAGDIDMHIVADGTNVWSEWAQPAGEKVVQKFLAGTMLKMGSSLHLNPVDCLRDVRARYCFFEVRSEKAGGVESLVFEGTLKDGALDRQTKAIEELGGPAMARGMRAEQELAIRARVTFTKDALQKIEFIGTGGESRFALTLSNTKLDVKLDESKFSYTPPKGPEIYDMEEQLRTTREHDGAK